MKKLELKFVDSMPQPLENGTLYVSIRFRIVSHNCCCGCGHEVVTNLSPSGWQLTYDGESISLFPSIGNVSLPCRSHYWIKRNQVIWEKAFSHAQVDARRDNVGKKNQKQLNVATSSDARQPDSGKDATKKGFWKKLMWWS
jgi:hypothetical protein